MPRVRRRAHARRACAQWAAACTAGALLSALACVHAAAAQRGAELGHASNALAGVDIVPVLTPQSTPLAASATLGYGYTEQVLDDRDSHHRIGAQLAIGYAALPWLALGARLDGRFDAHDGEVNGKDSGFLAQSQLAARAALALARDLRAGAELALRLPGSSDPGRGLSAASSDLRALLTWSPPESGWWLATALGFRIDRAEHGVADPDRLSLHDRVALGASDSNAVLLGAAIARRIGALALLGELSWDVQVGGAAPDALESPMRLSGGARLFPSDALHVQVIAGVSPSARPDVTATRPLYVIEPRAWITAGIGLYFDRASPPPPRAAPTPATAAPASGSVRGRALDAASQAPLPGVAIAFAGRSPVVTDTAGRFAIDRLAPGEYELQATASGFHPASARVRVVAGAVAELDVALERELPEGQIRGTVQTFGGKPLSARVVVQPLGTVVNAGPDGAFELDVAPGEYVVVVSAPGYRTQKRAALVELNGVTVIIVEMSTAR